MRKLVSYNRENSLTGMEQTYSAKVLVKTAVPHWQYACFVLLNRKKNFCLNQELY